MKVAELKGYKKVLATKPLKKGETIFELNGNLCNLPSKYTIQVDVSAHLEPFTGENSGWQFVNHSCSPNAFIDTTELKMKALSDINIGDEICFNYNTTEYRMASPFQCECGSQNCLGKIKGFSCLSDEQQHLLYPEIAPYLKMLFSAMQKKDRITQ